MVSILPPSVHIWSVVTGFPLTLNIVYLEVIPKDLAKDIEDELGYVYAVHMFTGGN